MDKERISELEGALRFIWELSGECLDNGDVCVGTAAEVAMRHIWRRAEKAIVSRNYTRSGGTVT